MEFNEDIFNQIHQYLNDNLEEQERQKFEAQMNQNPILVQEVATQRRIKSGLKINNYKQQFADIHTKLKAENELPVFDEKPVVKLNSSKSYLQYFAYAASVVLMVGVGIFFYLKPNPTEQIAQNKGDKNKPAIKTTKPDKVELANVNKSTKSSKSIDYNGIFARNFKNNPVIESPFTAEKYGISPSKITSWETDTLNLRKGIHDLASGKTKEAISQFQNLENSKFENIRFHADWYLAMSYLREKDILKSKKLLAVIRDNQKHIYSQEAKKVIELL